MDFAADEHFRSLFRSCEMRVEGYEMALVCQGVASQLRNHLQMGVRLRKLEFLGVENFAEHFAAAK